VRTLGAFLAEVGWEPPTVAGRVALHGHCHQQATTGTTAEVALLAGAGADVAVLDAGCCGLAGGFGFEAGDRYDVSMSVGRGRWGPQVTAADADVLVSDGFSCRTQWDHLRQAGAVDGPAPRHLAEVLDRALPR
jgi:Fe-S oxidoreductase